MVVAPPSDVFTMHSNIVKETVLNVEAKKDQLWKLFHSAFRKCIARNARGLISLDVSQQFFTVWVRKISHANMGQLMRNAAATRAETIRQKVKGGLSLRSKLYTL